MNDADIRKYAQLMAELGLTALEIDEVRGTVRLERAPFGSGSRPVAAAPSQVPAASTAPIPTGAGSTVTSPIVGIFYAAPMENADPYVKVGDMVKKGDVLCIIEAMKLMNEIVAERDGKITEVLVENGQLVDYGCPLFRMETIG